MIAILWNVRSIHNVASIFRTSDAVGVKKIYLVGITPTPRDRVGDLRPDFYKVALGAERTVPWESLLFTKAKKMLLMFRQRGLNILAVEQHKRSKPYFRLPCKYKFDKLVLLVGNEVKGLPANLLKVPDKILEIPMHGKLLKHPEHLKNQHPRHRMGKESLNVSVAFGVVAFGLRYRLCN